MAWKTRRPMRPNPLIPTRIAMVKLLLNQAGHPNRTVREARETRSLSEPRRRAQHASRRRPKRACASGRAWARFARPLRGGRPSAPSVASGGPHVANPARNRRPPHVGVRCASRGSSSWSTTESRPRSRPSTRPAGRAGPERVRGRGQERATRRCGACPWLPSACSSPSPLAAGLILAALGSE